jgi:hypothetical protein
MAQHGLPPRQLTNAQKETIHVSMDSITSTITITLEEVHAIIATSIDAQFQHW